MKNHTNVLVRFNSIHGQKQALPSSHRSHLFALNQATIDFTYFSAPQATTKIITILNEKNNF